MIRGIEIAPNDRMINGCFCSFTERIIFFE